MSTRQRVALPGCTPEPLAGYLKALGVFRLLAEQAGDSRVKGFWQHETFVLETELTEDDIVRFFLEGYVPTPLVAPWNGGSGFFAGDNQEALSKILASTHPRLALYRSTLLSVQALLTQLGIAQKPKDDMKMNLLLACRNELADEVVEWIDAVAMLSLDEPKFPPLLGTGGNDGRLEFTNNFMKNVTQLFDGTTGQPLPRSATWLRSALFGDPARGLVKSAIGQFAPGQAGGPNGTAGFVADSLINPWDFTLMMEGAIVFAAAATRKHERTRTVLMSYPFTVLPAGVGSGSTSAADDSTEQVRAEMWMPVWEQPATFSEIRHVFREGRAQLRSKPGKYRKSYRSVADGVDFARACATLAVDRGISRFQRYAFMKRAGKSYLAVPLTRFRVRSQPEAGLLTELDDWLQALKTFCDSTDVQSFRTAYRNIKAAMFALAEFGGALRVQNLLVQLAAVERLCVNNPKAREAIRPLVLNNEAWLHQAADASDEWAIAVALASLYPSGGAAPLRAYLSPVEPKDPSRWSQDASTPSVVWGTGDVVHCMARVLQRRLLDWHSAKKEARTDGKADSTIQMKPFHGAHGVSLRQVHRFLYGDAGMKRRIGDLVWALMPFTTGAIYRYEPAASDQVSVEPQPAAPTFVPWAYVTSRLVVSPTKWLAARVTEADGGASSEGAVLDMPIPGSLIPLLTSDRLRAATQVAEQRLVGSGIRLRFRGLTNIGVAGKDIAAALLIPLNARSTFQLLALARYEEANDAEQTPS
ncbi:MAG: type I-U CRISPR-associated protein Csx17 [Alicyclobacillus herbarius]|uniref:type I-G CRISPR-associated protein Cas8g1/Csx17 n=1 Tax=Alicyclobacillus herbarius TaxID=122960 RepID=UPI0023564D6E|nr:type I-U CRISPR-associated protein Csx17 [Alicyclobacillus herbarius]MCL6633682.1 type I-U CRISPR-associated protein Csx17 [Alicyclobacillus herbarius]